MRWRKRRISSLNNKIDIQIAFESHSRDHSHPLSRRPSVPSDRQVMILVWPDRVNKQLGEVRSRCQTLIVLSSDPLTSLPFLMTISESTAPLCPDSTLTSEETSQRGNMTIQPLAAHIDLTWCWHGPHPNSAVPRSAQQPPLSIQIVLGQAPYTVRVSSHSPEGLSYTANMRQWNHQK